MSVEALSAVLHHSKAKGTTKLVAVGIANHDGDGGAYPTVRTLAKYANVDVRNVQRALEKLASLGEVEVIYQAGGDRHVADHDRPNLYRLHVSCPAWCDRTTQHRDTRAVRQPNLRGLPGGGIATPPVAESSPPPVAESPPKPSPITQTNSVGTQLEAARAVAAVPCDECSAPSAPICEARQHRLPAESRHTYRAVARASR